MISLINKLQVAVKMTFNNGRVLTVLLLIKNAETIITRLGRGSLGEALGEHRGERFGERLGEHRGEGRGERLGGLTKKNI